MHRQFDKCWVEYGDPIDLMHCRSNIKIGLCWPRLTISGLAILLNLTCNLR